MTTAVRRVLRVRGIVQGVGFRPFVHRLAGECDVVGLVRNETGSVHIEVEGLQPAVDRFERRLVRDAPPLARIDTVDVHAARCEHDRGFRISPSATDRSSSVTPLIPPDTAVCDDCLGELFDPTDRRYRHPFITCTNCGPRFTIITALPYDRPNTTMHEFELCDRCAAEYTDVTDRRHHAQPIACLDCGPVLRYERGPGAHHAGTDAALAAAQSDLAAGRVVAIKGLGGYHLAVDAFDDRAVEEVRRRKRRPDKPFAVMVCDVEQAQQLASIDRWELDALRSPARPIVLVRARNGSPLSDLVAPDNPLVGLMLPYTPVHHLFFEPTPGADAGPPAALVMTSGNVADEPICFDDDEARSRLADLVDGWLVHDRPIATPCDDSVVRIVEGSELPIRRSRGFAPLPVVLPIAVDPVLAVGGEIKNTFALAAGRTAWISQHIGDMGSLETVAAFESSVERVSAFCGVEPESIAVDRHPDYHTRHWALRRTDRESVSDVQHHHAHLAALMAEHGVDGTTPVTGFVFDGTGLGDDGTLWGGEVLVADYGGFDRWGHLVGIPLPGGDAAVRNPWRAALAHLWAAGVEWTDDLAPVIAPDPVERRLVARQLDRAERLVATTSMGRLFDAVASLLGIRHRISFEAQAAIELEILATAADRSIPLRFAIDDDGTIDPSPVIVGLVEGLRSGLATDVLALSFHQAVAEAVDHCAQAVRSERALEVVGLTGGVFQNELLTRLVTRRLRPAGFEVLTHRLVPPNDGGLALGQVMVAAGRRKGDHSCA